MVKKCSDWRIVLVLTAREKQTLRNLTKDASSSVAVLDHEDLKGILLSGSPRERFLDLLIQQVNVAALSPFRVMGPVTEMFYGREPERRKIMNTFSHPEGMSFAVVGPRRIGKSSLLKRIKQEVEQKEGFKAIYLDSSIWRDDIETWHSAILRELGIQEERRELEHFVGAIDAYCRSRRLKLVLLLDDVDNLLSADERHDHIFFSTLRALINQACVKVLVAGYRTLYHQLFSDNSSLSSILEPIVLSALDRRDAFSHVKESLHPIFTIEHADIDCILDKTACHPSYVQFFCGRLVSHAYAQGQRTITRSDIVYVADSQDSTTSWLTYFSRIWMRKPGH